MVHSSVQRFLYLIRPLSLIVLASDWSTQFKDSYILLMIKFLHLIGLLDQFKAPAEVQELHTSDRRAQGEKTAQSKTGGRWVESPSQATPFSPREENWIW